MKENQLAVAPPQSSVHRKVFLKIGRPGYRVTKVRDRDTGKEGMMVQVHLSQVKTDVIPRRRFMSAWEQKREPPNKNYQYLIVSGLSLTFYGDRCVYDRLPLSHMRRSRSGSLLGRLRMNPMMLDIGIGRTGTQTRNNTASSLCFVFLIDHQLTITCPITNHADSKSTITEVTTIRILSVFDLQHAPCSLRIALLTAMN